MLTGSTFITPLYKTKLLKGIDISIKNMYNTIEVIILEIKHVEIKYFKKNGFSSVQSEGLHHVKALPFLSVVQSVEGSYDITLGNGKTEKTGDGGFFIAPSGVQQNIIHHDSKISGRMTCRWIFIDAQIDGTYSLDLLYRFPTVIADEKKNEISALFDHLFATDNVWDNYSDLYKLLKLLISIASPLEKQPHRGIQSAITYISTHYKEEITVRRLSEISSMSEPGFYAAFKKRVGSSPLAYLNSYRLSLAADKLTESDDTLSEIGYSVGINDPFYFSKLFKKTYGVSPKEYRLAYKGHK